MTRRTPNPHCLSGQRGCCTRRQLPARNTSDTGYHLEPPRECGECHVPLPAEHRRGPRRKYCAACSKGASQRAWRAANPEAIEAYNAARRAGLSELTCSECARTFTAARSHRLTCSEECRRARKRRLEAARKGAPPMRETCI